MRKHSVAADSVHASVSGCGSFVQVKPASGVQVAEQPSPLTALPSSHISSRSTLPSPHTAAQACVPVASRHAGSLVQVFEQPRSDSIGSPVKRPFSLPAAALVPSSQDSPASFMPLPHTDCTQMDGDPLHDQPGSVRQLLEQPIPGFGGSQLSVPMSMLSPQNGTQGLPGTRHCQPGVIIVQSAEQPPVRIVPSSHASVRETTPSPHTAAPAMQGWPG